MKESLFWHRISGLDFLGGSKKRIEGNFRGDLGAQMCWADGGVCEESEFLFCVSVVWTKQGVGIMAYDADNAQRPAGHFGHLLLHADHADHLWS